MNRVAKEIQYIVEVAITMMGGRVNRRVGSVTVGACSWTQREISDTVCVVGGAAPGTDEQAVSKCFGAMRTLGGMVGGAKSVGKRVECVSLDSASIC